MKFLFDMKLLYITIVPIDVENLDGVQRKVLSQSRALASYGNQIDLLYHHNGSIFLCDINDDRKSTLKTGGSRSLILSTAKELVANYDGFYIRYPLSDLKFLLLLKKIKSQNKRVVVEIPTYPYDQQGAESLRGKLIHKVDKLFRPWLHKYVDRICTYSLDKEIFRIKTINTVNGYDFSTVKPTYDNPKVLETINLIAVSGMWPLHGYDRFIRGLNDYYKQGGKRNIVLHVVGSGYVEADYKALTQKFGLQEHVIFHGRQFGINLMKLYSTQAIGVNSLAIHREGLERESTLKTKEYAALGLPIISSSFVDAFSEEGNMKFVLKIPADESNVNIKEVVAFADSLYLGKDIVALRNEIRADGFCTCDMKVTLKQVQSFFTEM